MAPDSGPRLLSHVLVTGASAGLGLELARLFAADGHSLVLNSRSEDRLESVARALRKDFEVDVRVMAGDLAAPGGAEILLERLKDEGPGVRVLVNNAGFGAYGPFQSRPGPIHRQMVELNIQAPLALARGLLPDMVAAAAGEDPLRDRFGPPGIMNVASTAAFQPGPLMATYFATKSFVLHFSEALHEEARGHGVTISAFCPGPTRTEFFTQETMIPTGAVTEEDLAEYRRRDARRMDAGVAAQAGYRGFRRGQAIVIPGWRNRVLASSVRFLPRIVVRRLAHRMMKKD